ncbi:MAG: NADP-dependent malic enzyme [Bacteroidales bacterium]|nr:NADP-dependent malic enzyme [Bacteroidales bacterium]
MDYRKESLKKHAQWRGKIEVSCRVPVSCREELSLAYTPGVAEPCLAIHEDVEKSFDLTRRWNTVPVITDGTAVLGLGDIGPEAGMPVMEGKCALFKAYGDVDAIPLCIRSKDTEEIIRTIKLIAGSFGGINLEDIAAPRCFEIEKRLLEELDIPVFHDDQHGTAIVLSAALLNALKLSGRKIEEVSIVINGAGAAGIAIAYFLMDLGAKEITVCDRTGIIRDCEPYNAPKRELARIINPEGRSGSLADAMKGTDIFIGVSGPGLVSPEMVRSMAPRPLIFPMANPVPEIGYYEALEAGAFIVGTGSSAFPNQINNVLVFPGLFRGALDARARTINRQMLVAAARALQGCIGDGELAKEHIIPFAWDKRAHEAVAAAVKQAAIDSGVSKLYSK